MNRSVTTILWISLFIKLLLSLFIPLSADEAYYWVWSKHLQLSYFDHPPIVAWLYWLGGFLENFYSAVRWPGVLLGHLTLIFWLRSLSPLFSEDQKKIFILLCLFSPLTGPGSLIVTPDLPMLFFGSLSFYFLSGAINNQSYFKLNWLTICLFTGVALGLSFSSKYLAVLFGPALLALLTEKQAQSKETAVKGFAFGLIGFLIFASPPFFWNYLNDWISFNFQMDHGLGGKSWLIKNTWHYIAAQIALISPPILFFAWKANAPRWLKVAAWFPLLFFLATTSRGYVEANWPIGAYIPLMALAALSGISSRWIKGMIYLWGLGLLLTLSLIFNFWLPISKDKIKLKELTRYNQISQELEGVNPLYARTYQMASKISFNQKRMVYKLRGFHRFDNFDLWPGSIPTADTIYVIAEPGETLPMSILDLYTIVSVKDLSEGFELRRLEKK